MPTLRLSRTAWCLLPAVWLSACSSFTSAPYIVALGQLPAAISGEGLAAPIPDSPDPAYRYLRVQPPGQPPALMVLGYEDAHPDGMIEVWYSARREVIKTQNGRIVATAGLQTDWLRSRAGAIPDWSQIPVQGAQHQRQRDLSRRYGYGIAETLTTLPAAMPTELALPPSLPRAVAAQLQWFRESVVAPATAERLPDAWFAFGPHRGSRSVVYSFQCLSADYCLHLQRWPQQAPQP